MRAQIFWLASLVWAVAPVAAGAQDEREHELARRVLVANVAESVHASEALEALERATNSVDPRAREAALLSLLDAAPDLSRSLAIRKLTDPDSSVRISALHVLAWHGSEVLPADLPALASNSLWSVRRAAALAAGSCRDDAAASILGRLLNDPDPDVQEAALKGLLLSEADTVAPLLWVAYDLPVLGQDGNSDEVASQARRANILERVRWNDDAASIQRLREILDQDPEQESHLELVALAAAGLARREDPIDEIHLPALVEAATSSDSTTRNAAQFALGRHRVAAADTVLAVLEHSEERQPAEALAELLVGLLGPDARAPLLRIAQGAEPVTLAARIAAVHALRRFGAGAPRAELVWVWSDKLPRGLREELLALFEDRPRDPSGRSGLLAALTDQDPNLRLRAFRSLLLTGASTRGEIDELLASILEERDESIRERMSRLLATHATGAGARWFALKLVELLDKPKPFPEEARAALENLDDPQLEAEIGALLLERLPPPHDRSTLRLFTRLNHGPCDEVVAAALREALDTGDDDAALDLLLQLRGRGGHRALSAAARALHHDSRDVRIEALRTLLSRTSAAALNAFVDAYPELSSDERREFVSLLRSPTEELTPVLSELLANELDLQVRVALVEKIGEIRAPLAHELIPLLGDHSAQELRVRAAESLARIADEVARDALAEFFLSQSSAAGIDIADRTDDMPLLLTAARSAGLSGAMSVAPELARLLFLRAGDSELDLADTDAVFPFEQTILGALLELAAAVPERRQFVAATIEQEVDQRAQDGSLFHLPKALFLRLSRELDAAPTAFEALRARLLEIALALPPREDRRELRCAIELAAQATKERDHARAASLYRTALLLIDLSGVQGARFLNEALGQPVPLTGFDPKQRLKARVLLSRAQAHAARGEDADALATFSGAARLSPFDAWLHLWIALDLAELQLSDQEATRMALRAVHLAPFDGDLLEIAAGILDRSAGSDGSDRTQPPTGNVARDRLAELKASGLFD